MDVCAVELRKCISNGRIIIVFAGSILVRNVGSDGKQPARHHSWEVEGIGGPRKALTRPLVSIQKTVARQYPFFGGTPS